MSGGQKKRRLNDWHDDKPPVPSANIAQYNFDVPREVKMLNDKKVPKIKPSLDVEYQRAKEIAYLRTFFADLCQSVLKIDPPSECFNRFLFEQLSLRSEETEQIDPLIKSLKLAVESPVIRVELESNLPDSTYISWGQRENVRAIERICQNFISAARYWISKSPASFSSHFQKELDRVYDRVKYSNLETTKQLFQQVQASIKTNMKEFFAAKINEVCTGLVNEGKKSAEKLQQVANESQSNNNNDNNNENAKSRVKMVETPGKERIELHFKDDIVYTTKFHVEKLRKLFMFHNPQLEPEFLDFLYLLLRRYTTFFGLTENEGKAFHAAAPATAFEYLRREFGVIQENFGSPLNCYYREFNSAFPDIDVFFGSLGSFFEYEPIEGSFETGPPYTLEVMDKMAVRLEVLLERSKLPLSFVVFVPDWQTPPADYIIRMGKSKWLRGDFVLQGRKYQYVSGNQHHVTDQDRFFVLPMDTHLYFLQNEAGAEKWPVSKAKVDGFERVLLGLDK